MQVLLILKNVPRNSTAVLVRNFAFSTPKNPFILYADLGELVPQYCTNALYAKISMLDEKNLTILNICSRNYTKYR